MVIVIVSTLSKEIHRLQLLMTKMFIPALELTSVGHIKSSSNLCKTDQYISSICYVRTLLRYVGLDIIYNRTPTHLMSRHTSKPTGIGTERSPKELEISQKELQELERNWN